MALADAVPPKSGWPRPGRHANDTLPFAQFEVFIDSQFGQRDVIATQYGELCMPSPAKAVKTQQGG
jgi:hypothetical protein